MRIASIARYLVFQSTPTHVLAWPGNSAITPFFESVFLNLLSYLHDPANNITTMLSMPGKEGIICAPSNFLICQQSVWLADMSYYMHVICMCYHGT